MGLTAPLRFSVEDPSGVAPVRRAASRLAQTLGLSEADAGRAATVATELATNLVSHAQAGEVILRTGRPGADHNGPLDIIAWDRGPGMVDVERCFEDGFSSGGGGAGTGLGAVRRMSDQLEIYSNVPGGTIAIARIGHAPAGLADGLVLAVAPEVTSGDAWAIVDAPDGPTLLLADGLGHGPGAAEASEKAAACLRPAEDVLETLERVHEALGPTRGAAVAVARVDRPHGVLQFAGAGNISAVLWSRESTQSLTSFSGTAGRQIKTIKRFDYALPEAGLLVMHSDGVRDGWDLAREPALRRRDPLLISAALIRDWERGRDDASVIVLPLAREPR